MLFYRSCDTICDKNRKTRFKRSGKRIILVNFYKKELTKHQILVSSVGGSRRIRTIDLPGMNRTLWPAELLSRIWLREEDLNLRPSGYEPDELPDCSIPRCEVVRLTTLIIISQSQMFVNTFLQIFSSDIHPYCRARKAPAPAWRKRASPPRGSQYRWG